MQIDNLTPGPFPSGKGSKMRRAASLLIFRSTFPPSSIWFLFPSGKGSKNEEVSVALGLCPPFPHRKGGEGDRTPPSSDNSGSPSHYGKGLGVRFLILILTLTTSCAQVHEKLFTLNCAINRRPLPGELAPNTAMALDVSTSPIPLLFPAHRAIARCDNAGLVTLDIETPVDTGISQLSTPISTAASHITYAP